MKLRFPFSFSFFFSFSGWLGRIFSFHLWVLLLRKVMIWGTKGYGRLIFFFKQVAHCVILIVFLGFTVCLRCNES